MRINNITLKVANKIYAIVSLTVLTFVLSARIGSSITIRRMFVGVILAFCIWAYLVILEGFLDELFCNCELKMISFVLAIIWLRNNIHFFICNSELSQYINIDSKKTKLLIAGLLICSLYGAYILMYKLFNTISFCMKIFLDKSSHIERKYCIIWIFICIVGISLVYMSTNAFYNPGNYNILYTFDSEGIYSGNSYMIVGGQENDIRQSLFGFFSLPISLPAAFFAMLLPFKYSYAVFVQILQAILIGVGIILISRMMDISEKRKVGILVFLSSICSTILFVFVMEQYIILVFYLIVTIYCIVNKTGDRELCAIAAVGTAPTNALVLFWELRNRESFKSFFEFGFKAFVKYLAFLICLGQTGFILSIYDNIKFLTGYSGNSVAIANRIQQFIFFVRSCFLWPASSFSFSDSWTKGPFLKMDVVSQYSIVGIILLIIAVCGVIFFSNNLFYKICVTWIVFSFVLLVVMGYCAATNDMLLFAHYFGWAYAVLIINVYNKLIVNDNIFNILIMGVSLFLVLFNLGRLNVIMPVLIKYYCY